MADPPFVAGRRPGLVAVPADGAAERLRGVVTYKRHWDHLGEENLTDEAAIREVVPGARVALLRVDGEQLVPLSEGVCDLDGVFTLRAPLGGELRLELLLDDGVDGRIVVRGNADVDCGQGFRIHEGAVVSCATPLDLSAASAAAQGVLDVGDVEFSHDTFRQLAFVYSTFKRGSNRFLADVPVASDWTLPIRVPAEEPSDAFYRRSVQSIFLGTDCYRDDSVHLHEFGHFAADVLGPGYEDTDYSYGDDEEKIHTWTSHEHYHVAWNEALATFVSCHLRDDPFYREYEGRKPRTVNGGPTDATPHNELAVGEVLWVLRTHTSFAQVWGAYADRSRRSVGTLVDLYENWHERGDPSLELFKDAMWARRMRWVYLYEDGWTCADAFDQAAKTFATVEQLYAHLGTLEGGTLSEYRVEFYNRNANLEPHNELALGSSELDPVPVVGQAYRVPRRMAVTLDGLVGGESVALRFTLADGSPAPDSLEDGRIYSLRAQVDGAPPSLSGQFAWHLVHLPELFRDAPIQVETDASDPSGALARVVIPVVDPVAFEELLQLDGEGELLELDGEKELLQFDGVVSCTYVDGGVLAERALSLRTGGRGIEAELTLEIAGVSEPSEGQPHTLELGASVGLKVKRIEGTTSPLASVTWSKNSGEAYRDDIYTLQVDPADPTGVTIVAHAEFEDPAALGFAAARVDAAYSDPDGFARLWFEFEIHRY